MATLRERLAVGAFWTISFRFATRFIGIISTAILARLLVPEDFGLVTLAATSVAIANAFTEFGPEQYLISHQDSKRAEYDTAWTMQILRGLIIASLMVLFAERISNFFHEPRLADTLIVMSLGILLRSFANIGVVDFRKKLNFQKDFQLLLIPRLVSFFVTIGLALTLKNYWALIWGLMSGHVAYTVSSYAMHNFRPKLGISAFGKLFGFSKWVFANSILQFLIYKFDTFLLGRMLGTRILGLYSVSFEISTLATSEVAAPIRRAILPGYSKVSGDPQALRGLYLDVFALTIMLTVPAAVGIMATSDLIVFTLLGDKWADAIPIIEIVAISGALQSIGSGAGPLFLAAKCPRHITIIMICTITVQIPLMIWALNEAGVIGVAWALVATWAWRQLLTFYFVTLTIGTRLRDHLFRIWRTLVSASLMYGLLYWVRGLIPELENTLHYATALFVCVTLGFIIFCTTHYALWLLSGKAPGPETHATAAFQLIYQKIHSKRPGSA